MLQHMQRFQDSQDSRHLEKLNQSLQRRVNTGKLTNPAYSARLLQRCVDLGVFVTPGASPGDSKVGVTDGAAATPSPPRAPFKALHSLMVDLVAFTCPGTDPSTDGEICDWELTIVGIILHRQLTMPQLLQAMEAKTAPASAFEPMLSTRSDFQLVFAPLVALLAHGETRVQHEAAQGTLIHIYSLVDDVCTACLARKYNNTTGAPR